MILVTGGAGFIGSHFVNTWTPGEDVTVVDKMTYAADMKRITRRKIHFLRGNIRSHNTMSALLAQMKPRAIFHFAAESHVTKSIKEPDIFFKNNVDGTLVLLTATLEYWKTLNDQDRAAFRFVHISTDEVFGSLGSEEKAFTEDSPHRPSTPYAASKAASDHLVRCFHVTYGLPALILNSTNNYGIGQHKEKLIPLVISNALAGKPITVHGDGLGTRDWLHVEDFCEAIRIAYDKGSPGESYVVGGMNEKTVLKVIFKICSALEVDHDLITHVPDRPGNDRRYAVNPAKLMALGWAPKRVFDLAPIIESLTPKRKAA